MTKKKFHIILAYMDNFEWQKGYALTFGLCAVDRKTQMRTPKKSLGHLGGYR